MTGYLMQHYYSNDFLDTYVSVQRDMYKTVCSSTFYKILLKIQNNTNDHQEYG